MFKFRIGDKVKVLTGKYKKMHGVIRDIVPKKYQAIINTNSKGKKKVKYNFLHKKVKMNNSEFKIHLSNISIIEKKKGINTRIGFAIINNNKVRIMKKNKSILL